LHPEQHTSVISLTACSATGSIMSVAINVY